MQKRSARESEQAPTKARWNTKRAHPQWALEADICPNCGFPEAEGGYCPDCGWTLPRPVQKKR